MPTFTLEIPDTHDTVTRPVSLKIIDDLKKMTGLELSTDIQFNGGSARPIQVGSALEPKAGSNLFPSRGLWTIDVAEEDVEGGVLSTAALRHDQKKIFNDDALDIFLRPIYSETEMSITITAKFNSRIAAEKWREGIRVKVTMGRVETFHEITYHYRIPDETLFILNALHYYRENNAGYGEDLRTWVRACADDRVTTLVNQAANNPMMSVAETQIRALGWFDFEFKPNPATKNQDNGTWEVSFDYRVRYQKPISMTMSYPLMIHNQILPQDLSYHGIPMQVEQYAQHGSTSTEAYIRQENKRLPWVRSGIGGISVPFFDDWYPYHKSPSTTTLMRIMIQLDPNDRRALLNLRELGEYEIDSDVLDYIAQDPAGLTLDGGSALRITLYNSRYPMAAESITVDSDLNVRAVSELSERLTYHLVISLTNDLLTLTNSAKTLLRRNANACLKFFLVMDKDLAHKGRLPKPIGRGIIPPMAFTKTVAYLNERFTINYPRRDQHWVTVTYFATYVNREKERANC